MTKIIKTNGFRNAQQESNLQLPLRRETNGFSVVCQSGIK